MEQLFTRLWAYYEKNTYVRHVVVPAIAGILIEVLNPLVEYFTTAAEAKPVRAILFLILAAAVRRAIKSLEAFLRTHRVPESRNPAEL